MGVGAGEALELALP